MALSDLLQGCSNKSDIQSWYNKNVTKLTTQGCNNIVISWLYRMCWNNLATSLIISIRLLQLLTTCSILVLYLGQAVQTQLVDSLLADLLRRVFCVCRCDLKSSGIKFSTWTLHIAWTGWTFLANFFNKTQNWLDILPWCKIAAVFVKE
jgi:hypothetical protein